MGSKDWQAHYKRYRALEKQLVDTTPRDDLLLTILNAAPRAPRTFQTTRDSVRLKFRRAGRQWPSDLVRELSLLAELQSSYDQSQPAFVFDDVYHLAFDQLGTWRRYGQPVHQGDEASALYRGQRSVEWDIEASIYRGLDGDPHRREELRRRSFIAARLGHAIARQRSISFSDGMAIVQHYSRESSTPTWMVDFSYDPWVALFFASDGGCAPDRGVVWSISPERWTELARGTDNTMGELRLSVPRGAWRIENQAGVFVAAAHPAFFNQYVPFGRSTEFCQRDGLVFEDPSLGITRATIYPENDPDARAVVSMACSTVERGNAFVDQVPDSLFADPTDPETYVRILSCWSKDQTRYAAPTSNPSDSSIIFRLLARFHAYVQAAPLHCRVTGSIYRLLSAFERASTSDPLVRLTARDAIEHAYIHPLTAGSPDAAILRAVLQRLFEEAE